MRPGKLFEDRCSGIPLFRGSWGDVPECWFAARAGRLGTLQFKIPFSNLGALLGALHWEGEHREEREILVG